MLALKLRAVWSCLIGPAALTLALSAAVALWPSQAFAFELRQTTSGKTVRWPSHEVAIEVDPSVLQVAPGALDAVAAAMASWTATGSAPELHVTENTASSSPAVDGHNVVYYAAAGWPEAGSALAITLVSFDEVTGEIVDADIVLNGRYSFAVLSPESAPPPGTTPIANDPALATAGVAAFGGTAEQFDLVHVLSHETGHLLGLLDAPSDPSDVMYLYTSAHDAARRAPAEDDIAGIDTLYESGASQAGCSVARGRPQSPAWGALLAVGLAAVVFYRRSKPR